MKIIFTGGGTGGHIFPIIAVIREIRRSTDQEIEFYYLGPKHELGQLLLSEEGVNVKTIVAGKVRRYWSPKSIFLNLFDLLIKMPIGFLQSFFYLLFLNPDLIFSKGGPGSLPVVWWGWFFLTPVLLHESDIAPGLTNKIASRFASEVFVSFPETEYFSPKKMIWVGNPIRTRLLKGSKQRAEEVFNLSGEKRPLALVLGGSQGAQRINDLILAVLPEYLESFELIHQTGTKNYESVKKEAQVMMEQGTEKYYHPVSFLQEAKLKHAYAVAELIVSRAGSGIIFEVTALGKPAIFIPLPEAAQNHQYKNAYYITQNEAGIVLEEENLTPHFLLERVKFLFSHPQQMREISKNAKQFSEPRAGKIIAEYIVEYLSQ